MKTCRVLLYLRSLSKNCLVFVFPESTVSWTGKHRKAHSVLQRQGKRQVSGQTWAVSTLLTPWAACRPWGALSIGKIKYLQCISVMNDVRMNVFMCIVFFLLVQFSCSVVSNSLRPHEPQHARPPCSSPAPRGHPNPCPLCWWCHPTISSSVVPFSFFPQSFFSNESALRMWWSKYWSFSFNFSPTNEHPGLISFRMDRLDLVTVQGTLKSLQYHS